MYRGNAAVFGDAAAICGRRTDMSGMYVRVCAAVGVGDEASKSQVSHLLSNSVHLYLSPSISIYLPRAQDISHVRILVGVGKCRYDSRRRTYRP